MDKYLKELPSRILQNISDEILTSTPPQDVADQYYVHRTVVLRECRLRGIRPYSHRRRWQNIQVTYDEVMDNSYSQLAEKYKVSVPTMIKIAVKSLNLSNEEIILQRDAKKGKLHTPVEELTDEELQQSVTYLRRRYKFSQQAIANERKKRNITVASGPQFNEAVQQLSDDELFSKTLQYLADKTNTSPDTISRERRRRREAK